MQVREIMRRGCAMLVVVAMVGYYGVGNVKVEANTKTAESITSTKTSKSVETTMSTTEAKKKVKDYIVKVKNKKSFENIEKEYSESDEINENGGNFLEDNKMVSVELSSQQLKTLSRNDNVNFIEEDKLVTASSNEVIAKKTNIKKKKIHKLKKKVYKKNTADREWNVQMIQADQVVDDAGEKVKVAILDSGIDWGNDINLAYQVSLVPGEEEMTQIFMDGNGHGSSVASLIAANNDGEGITGINTNVDIYSYRVLGDDNQAPVSRVIEAIYMAIEQKVNIINMSFGLSEYSEALEQAVHDAQKAGILIIAAAGNTGEGGVQYPAALDDVMAVGAVNKDGIVEEYSAKGKEIEIVAPGELVNTTGFLGTEEVTSGTSLSTPQITAIAALIWQKDLTVSADFVRGLLDESANLYGDKESYGYGLVDAEYALNHYKEYKEKYENSSNKEGKSLILENEREVTTFEDTGCVKGCWGENKHAELVTGGYVNVRRGARIPDITSSFKTAGVNPWWHGFYEQNQGTKRASNYIKAVFTIASIADAVGEKGKTYYTSLTYKGYNEDERTEIINDLKALNWDAELKKVKGELPNQTDSKGFRRAIIWGMAIHSATDIFAHSACVNGTVIDHDPTKGVPADDWNYITDRNVCATRAAREMLIRYQAKEELNFYDFIPFRKFNGFTLKSLAGFSKAYSDGLGKVIYDYGYSYSGK